MQALYLSRRASGLLHTTTTRHHFIERLGATDGQITPSRPEDDTCDADVHLPDECVCMRTSTGGFGEMSGLESDGTRTTTVVDGIGGKGLRRHVARLTTCCSAFGARDCPTWVGWAGGPEASGPVTGGEEERARLAVQVGPWLSLWKQLRWHEALVDLPGGVWVAWCGMVWESAGM